ncbi:MAG: 50S ribosomal protein L11 methyltransferase [Bryobacteraceae bacterium]
MFSLLLTCAPAMEDELIAELYDAGTTGIAEESGGLRAFFADDVSAPTLFARFAPFQPQLRREEDVDWEQVTRDAWPPLLVGKRFFLAPSWNADPAPAGRIRLEVHPGMVCGTGWHPCTQLCLEALERTVRPGTTVLDVGSGSGILSDAARLLGAARVIACDVDVDAVRIARERVRAPMFAGSVDAVRADVADVIVANISSVVAEELAPEFARVRRPASTLILSGFAGDDLPEGYRPRDLLRRDGWACVIC